MKLFLPQKKSLFSVFLLSLFFTLSSNAQIKLLAVNTTDDTITITNFGTTTIDIADYWFCSLFSYAQLNTLTVDSGSLNLANKATVTLSGFSLNNLDADVGLYLPINSNADFANGSFMVDFMQYGASGNGRESVADGAEIWQAGTFLPGAGPFIYTGDGSQSGVGSWANGTLGINDVFLNSIISIHPNPAIDNLTIRTQETVDLKIAYVFDLSGRLVSKTSLNQRRSIQLNNLSKGFYLLKIEDGEGRILVKKFMKQ